MGWAGGSGLFNDIIDSIKPIMKNKKARVKLYKRLIEAFENYDWDTQGECMGNDPAFDQAFRELHPNWFEDEQE